MRVAIDVAIRGVRAISLIVFDTGFAIGYLVPSQAGGTVSPHVVFKAEGGYDIKISEAQIDA